ncbi:S41 family peptidase [Archangium lansingense]|uniref:S41 family peptidase n=1 Tax=Archangium lansingense TaxID=2995310 RepID=UPI003B79B8CB
MGLAARAAPAAEGTPELVEATPDARLAALCRVWGAVEHFHPALPSRDIDWDAALVETAPRVMEARSPEALSETLQGMLGGLGDPVTRVARQAPSTPAPSAGSTPLSRQVGDVLVVDLDRRYGNFQELYMAVSSLGPELAKARRVVVDLRASGADEAIWMDQALGFLTGALPSEPVTGPGERYLQHSGYRIQFGATSGGYGTTMDLKLAEGFASAPGAPKRSVAFLVNARTPLVPLLLAMVGSSSRTFLVAQGALDESSAVKTMELPLAGGHRAIVRTSELVFPQGSQGLRADVTVPASADEGEQGPAIQAALKLVRTSKAKTPARHATPRAGVPTWHAEETYADQEYPSPGLRTLAVCRFWNVMRYFHPDPKALGDWDAVLPEFLRKAREATDARAYALTLYELSARVHDGHIFLAERGTVFRTLGEATAPILPRYVEGRPLMTELLDANVAREAGLVVGDELLTVDGQPVEERAGFLRRHLAASTPAALSLKVAEMLLAGPDGSQVSLRVRSADGRQKELKLPRSRAFLAPFRKPSAEGEPYRKLEGNLGYVDLRLLRVEQLDPMLEALKGTRGIIFDMRGQPQSTAWALAPRLNVKGARHAAVVARPLVSSGQRQELRFSDTEISRATPPRYTGSTVMLVDERASSQAEYTAMMLQAAAGTRLVGAPTAGAVGDTTNVCLPGAVCVLFTGQLLLYPDGRPVQGVGVTPDVEVRPTVKGIRAGRDEVLERAISTLRD